MKKTAIILATILSIGILSFTIDEKSTETSNNSDITWIGKKLTGQHEGTINLKTSTLDFDGEELIAASFTVDMTSIKCTDLDSESAGDLESHLKSADFFDTDEHKTSSFKAFTIENKGDGNYIISGELTIKDITNTIKFDANITVEDNVATAISTLLVDRTKYDIKYSSGSFFDGLGDKLIYDEFELNINIEHEL